MMPAYYIEYGYGEAAPSEQEVAAKTVITEVIKPVLLPAAVGVVLGSTWGRPFRGGFIGGFFGVLYQMVRFQRLARGSYRASRYYSRHLD